MITISSAYASTDTLAWLPHCIPRFDSLNCKSVYPGTSLIKILNREGESRHPCFTPQLTLDVHLWFTSTAHSVPAYIHVLKLLRKLPIILYRDSLCHSRFLSTESNALCKSTKHANVSLSINFWFNTILFSVSRAYGPDTIDCS